MGDLPHSILYERSFWWAKNEGAHGIGIRFNENNTGELLAQGELGAGTFFGVNTRWRLLENREPATPSDEVDKLVAAGEPADLCHAKLEIILENSLTEGFKRNGCRESVNRRLTPAAFMPRTFMVTIQAGNFMYERCIGTPHDYERFGLRLTFDPSPYPTAEGYVWDDDFPPVDEWCPMLLDTKVFYSKSLPKSARKVRATNDHSTKSQD